MARLAYVYVNYTHLYNSSPPSFYVTTVVLNDCYSEVTANTVLAYSYWASLHDTYGCLRHALFLFGSFSFVFKVEKHPAIEIMCSRMDKFCRALANKLLVIQKKLFNNIEQ